MCISTFNLRKLIEEKLKAYGLLEVKTIIREEEQIHSVRLMSLPLIIQNTITIVTGAKGFRVSSGAVFDSKDANKEVIHEAEKIMNKVAEERGLTVRKAADSFWVEKDGEKLNELKDAIEKVAEAIRELNQLFSGNKPIREECLYKKMRQTPLF